MSDLVALEGRYRYGGLSSRERLDLDRRYALIDDQLRIGAAVAPDAGWVSMSERKLDLDNRIDRGVRSGQLTSAEADRLRDDFAEILRVEANYRVDGLSPAERQDLNERFDQLSAEIRVARTDDDRSYGWNRY
jgi:hypothetical protein